MIKRLLFGCKHEWVHVDTEYYLGQTLSEIYGCNICGKTEEVLGMRKLRWVFEQQHKGATVDGE